MIANRGPTMSAVVRTLRAVSLAGALLALSFCSDRTPTGPSGKAAIALSVRLASEIVAAPGTVVVDSSACSCATKDISLSANGQRLGNFSCGSSSTFALPSAADHYDILMTSPEIQPVTLILRTSGPESSASFGLSVRCPSSSGP
jgi:hypothetical protein